LDARELFLARCALIGASYAGGVGTVKTAKFDFTCAL
jgi:hypothetical protein